MIELYRSENLLVRSLPAQDRSRWIVTFDNYGIGHGFDRPGFGQAYLQAAKISAIHVMGVREDWYQYPDIFEAMAAVRKEVAGALRVMTYGSSMGGYAALRFAEAAGANATLALSPQYTIDPEKVPFELRWTQDAGRIQWRADVQKPLALGHVPVVIYDPQILDAQHVAMIARETPIHAIRMPYTGHPVTTTLSEVGLLKALVQQTLAGELDVDAFQKQALIQRRKSPHYLANLAEAQSLNRPLTAYALAHMAINLSPNNRTGKLVLAKIQSRFGYHEQAIETLRPVVKMIKADLLFMIPLAEILAAGGHYNEALEIAAKVVELQPDSVHLWAWKAHFLWLDGQGDEAIELVKKAMALDPLNRHYARSLEAYEEAKRAQEAELDASTAPDASPSAPITLWKRLVQKLRRGT